MFNRKPIIFMLIMVLFTTLLAGCSSGSNALIDDNGKEVSLEKQDQPSLVFFFTGVG